MTQLLTYRLARHCALGSPGIFGGGQLSLIGRFDCGDPLDLLQNALLDNPSEQKVVLFEPVEMPCLFRWFEIS